MVRKRQADLVRDAGRRSASRYLLRGCRGPGSTALATTQNGKRAGLVWRGVAWGR